MLIKIAIIMDGLDLSRYRAILESFSRDNTHAANNKVKLPEVMAGNWELDGHKNAERWSFA